MPGIVIGIDPSPPGGSFWSASNHQPHTVNVSAEELETLTAAQFIERVRPVYMGALPDDFWFHPSKYLELKITRSTESANCRHQLSDDDLIKEVYEMDLRLNPSISDRPETWRQKPWEKTIPENYVWPAGMLDAYVVEPPAQSPACAFARVPTMVEPSAMREPCTVKAYYLPVFPVAEYLVKPLADLADLEPEEKIKKVLGRCVGWKTVPSEQGGPYDPSNGRHFHYGVFLGYKINNGELSIFYHERAQGCTSWGHLAYKHIAELGIAYMEDDRARAWADGRGVSRFESPDDAFTRVRSQVLKSVQDSNRIQASSSAAPESSSSSPPSSSNTAESTAAAVDYVTLLLKMKAELEQHPDITIEEFSVAPPATDAEILFAKKMCAERGYGNLPAGMEEFYRQVGALKVEWRHNDDADKAGCIDLLRIADLNGRPDGHDGTVFGNWFDCLWFDFPGGDEFKDLCPVDFFIPEACTVLCPQNGELKIAYHYCGEDLYPTGVDYGTWVRLLIASKGYFYWVQSLVPGRGRDSDFFTCMSELFPDSFNPAAFQAYGRRSGPEDAPVTVE